MQRIEPVDAYSTRRGCRLERRDTIRPCRDIQHARVADAISRHQSHPTVGGDLCAHLDRVVGNRLVDRACGIETHAAIRKLYTGAASDTYAFIVTRRDGQIEARCAGDLANNQIVAERTLLERKGLVVEVPDDVLAGLVRLQAERQTRQRSPRAAQAVGAGEENVPLSHVHDQIGHAGHLDVRVGAADVVGRLQ